MAAEQWLARRGKNRIYTTDPRIAGFCRGLRFCGNEIRPRLVEHWVTQYAPEIRPLWLPVLTKLRQDYFFDERRVNRYLKHVYEQAMAYLGRDALFKNMRRSQRQECIAFVEIAGMHKSEGRILHRFRLVNGLKMHVTHIDRVLERWRGTGFAQPLALLAVDDFVGSGDSGVKFLDQAFARSLVEQGAPWTNMIRVVYLAACGFEAGRRRMEAGVQVPVTVILGKTLGEQDRVFSPETAIVPDPEKRELLQVACEAVGRELRPQHPLGYGNGQALVVFSYDIPNNSLPVLYEPGVWGGKEWLPLFRRPDAKW